MAMSLGSGRGFRADINMTPMIDVLLVLIIIFMVIVPTTSRGLEALVPQNSQDPKPSTPTVNDDVVITVNGDRSVQINREPVTMAGLGGRLEAIFRANPNHVLFVRGAKGLEFQPIADVIDVARGAGLHRIALMTQ